MSVSVLNIAQVCPVTAALGPGRRFVLWVQGCPFSCRGCVAPDWIPVRPANQVKVVELAANLLKLIETEKLEGITISGGEPMLQAAGLVELIELVRQRKPEFSVILFSGYKLSDLKRQAQTKSEIAVLLKQSDVLIDGLYVEAQNDGKGLRGSANQQIHFLSDRYIHLASWFNEKPRSTELHQLSEEILMVGIPSAKFLKTFRSMSRRIRKI